MATPGFMLFSKLPAELQIAVWEMVDIPPSLIAVQPSQEIQAKDYNYKFQPCLNIKYRLHSIFHACQLSRMTALQSHPLRFGNGLWGPAFATPFPFDAEKDVLFFTPMDLSIALAMNCPQDFASVYQIAVEPGYTDNYGTMVRTMVSAFQLGTQLETIHIVPKDNMGTTLALVAEKDGGLDYKRIGNTILPCYIMRLVVMRAKEQISEEEKDSLMLRKFCVMSPADFEEKFGTSGVLNEEQGIECGCSKVPVRPT